MRGKIYLWVALWTVLSAFSLPAAAAPRDAAAKKKIEEAIYTHFLNMNFDMAEGLLVGTYRACEDKCSPEIKAKLWMYVGVVRGSGRQDLGTAEEAFVEAFKEDPNVQLDAEIATPEVKEVFERVRAARGGGGGGGQPVGGGSGGMRCSLSASEVQSRRPIPIECESDEDLDHAKLFFANFKVSWQSVNMEPEEGLWRGTIPCSVTQNTGALKWYVEGYDEEDDLLDNLGNEDDWQEIEVVAQTEAEPPAFPDEDPPDRCDISDVGPATMGNCGGWGGACGDGDCCETGLTCIEGVCEQAQCEWDSDCDGGAECKKGKCVGGEEASGPYAKNLLGVHFAADLGSISTEGACTPDSRANDSFVCSFGNGQEYTGFPHNGNAGRIDGGFSLATLRALVSYERLFGALGLGARLGYAFNGGPNLMPVHAEARLKYWVTGENAFSKRGIRAWLHLGGGLAQIDVKVPVDIRDCQEQSNDPGFMDQEGCTTSTADAPPGSRVLTVDATKQLGLMFVGGGGGLMWAIGRSHGPALNVNVMVPLPSTGLVIEPSLGYHFGF